MKITIVYPASAHSAYRVAADEFAALAAQVSAVKTECRVVTDEEYGKGESDLTVLIGSDAVNPLVADLYLSLRIGNLGIRYGTDDYTVRTQEADGRQVLILAGGRPRSALYAVYRYFEIFCGCRWFWDGDRLPKTALPTAGIDLTESPRFDYRGIRYFAHRSLHRFQAEHWNFEDWKREIDWLLKKRMNLFMLRIGMDDLFQKAFPDVVSYPDRDKTLPEAGEGFDDRTLFWSLQYRGELRKKVLRYAFARDLMHPEDCGTMSHWYSRTPREFLEKKDPPLLAMSHQNYSDRTGYVWDIRHKENFDNYFKLTETHVKEYGKPELFHTIGLGERRFSEDPEVNKRMKLFVYHKIAARVKEEYPNAPLLIASWDLWMHFTPEEVRVLVADLDPAQAIILDYTSDTARDNNFTRWGLLGRFPWIFGIFGGYEPNSDIRGFYDLANERLKTAKADPACKGMIYWPELSHGDPFAIEYVTRNAWERETPPIGEQVARYCRDRYPAALTAQMTALWRDFMPIVQTSAWSVDQSYHMTGRDVFLYIARRAEFEKERADFYGEKVALFAPHKKAAAKLLSRLAEIKTDDEMTRRDLFDIARTVIGRYLNAAIYKTERLYAVGAPAEELTAPMAAAEALTEALIGVLAVHEDYSLLASLRRLQSVTETNPNFEETLKNNAECSYCRSFIYENAAYLYLPEMKMLFAQIKKCAQTGEVYNRETLTDEQARIRARYFATPLAEMRKDHGTFAENLQKASAAVSALPL